MPQITIRNNETALIRIAEEMPDNLGWCAEQYSRFEVTTGPASQKVQQRDLNLCLRDMIAEERTDQREAWTPRRSRDFQLRLRQTLHEQGQRIWSDKTIIRVMAHLKTFDHQQVPPFLSAPPPHSPALTLSSGGPKYLEASRR
jgi:hypothetical protein